jgi:molybdate transport system ATP-binding protein
VSLLDVHVRRHTVDARFRLRLQDRGVTVLFGPSGSGKTTVLRCIAGLDRSEGGHVVMDGTVWDDPRHWVPARSRRVGYLFQDHALFPHLDVEANVAFGMPRMSAAERRLRVRDALAATDAAHCAGRRVAQLSGGEAQRVALARALAAEPRLLLLDEPLSALDAPTRSRLRVELRRMLERSGVPAVIVTHDRTEALALADRVVVLVDGRVRQVGTPTEVFDRPADADVARIVGVETAAAGTVQSVEDRIVGVRVGGVPLTALATGADPEAHAAGDAVLVCIRAEDVALELPGSVAGGRSPRNHLPARVTATSVEGALVRVDLDAGFPLTAFITRPSLEDLGLAVGSAVVASVKSPAVHLVTRTTAHHSAGSARAGLAFGTDDGGGARREPWRRP